MKPCRVCRRRVKPWRRGWRRPTTTIHAHCLRQRCRYCGLQFTVGKERRGHFCSNAHQADFKRYGGRSPDYGNAFAGWC